MAGSILKSKAGTDADLDLVFGVEDVQEALLVAASRPGVVAVPRCEKCPPEEDSDTCKRCRRDERRKHMVRKLNREREGSVLARGRCGIPEKRGGWELNDITYHGGMFYAGEW